MSFFSSKGEPLLAEWQHLSQKAESWIGCRRKQGLKPPGTKKRQLGQAGKAKKAAKSPTQPHSLEAFDLTEDIPAEAPTLRQSTRQRVEEAQKERQRIDKASSRFLRRE